MIEIGFLLGWLNGRSTSTCTTSKISDNVKYSARWWMEEANATNLHKAQVVTHFQPLIREGLLEKERTNQGLAIFVPTSKTAKHKALAVIENLKSAK